MAIWYYLLFLVESAGTQDHGPCALTIRFNLMSYNTESVALTHTLGWTIKE